jgi:hypothetical protein
MGAANRVKDSKKDSNTAKLNGRLGSLRKKGAIFALRTRLGGLS